MTEINKWHDVNGHFFSDCEMEMIRESIKINIHVLEKRLQDEKYISQVGEEWHKREKYRMWVLEMFLECTEMECKSNKIDVLRGVSCDV